MATKSILKDVVITSRRAKHFIQTLEKAESAPIKDVEISKPVKVISKESIKQIFNKGN